MHPRLQETQEAVAEHMDGILTNFKPGAKITVLVRFDGNDEQDFLMTNDALPDAIAALDRRHKAGAT